MNVITQFFHELLNPHCEHCNKLRQEELEQKEIDREINGICQSCETLKMQLSLVNQQNSKLLDKLTESKIESVAIQTEVSKPIKTMTYIPWPVQRQMLEQKSREEALAKSKAAVPDAEKIEDIQKLEDLILSGEVAGSNAGN